MSSVLAIDGGTPVRREMLPYARHEITDEDVAAVEAALRSGWLTGGPRIRQFEEALALAAGAADCVAVSSGTAALHAMLAVLDIGPGDEVILPPMTFVATATAILLQGAQPVFADVDPETLLLNPVCVRKAVNERTRAVIAVDFAGQLCDYDALRKAVGDSKIHVLSDSCHALGAADKGRTIGSLAEMAAFSFHPAKHVTTGEGGAIAVASKETAARLRSFRNHSMDLDPKEREKADTWVYKVQRLGMNYRMTELQAALGLSQLGRLPDFLARRTRVVERYDEAFGDHPHVQALGKRGTIKHANHLYVLRLKSDTLRVGRKEVFQALRREGIGVNVHYVPVHRQPVYAGLAASCPNAESAYEEILSLPLYHGMAEGDAVDVVAAVDKVTSAYAKRD